MSQREQELQDKIRIFSDEKFGASRSFIAPLHHLIEEAKEAMESGEISEFADIYILLMDAASKKGYTVEMLLAAAETKFDEIQGRTWGEPDENGVYHHIEEKEQEVKEEDFNDKTIDHGIVIGIDEDIKPEELRQTLKKPRHDKPFKDRNKFGW